MLWKSSEDVSFLYSSRLHDSLHGVNGHIEGAAVNVTRPISHIAPREVAELLELGGRALSFIGGVADVSDSDVSVFLGYLLLTRAYALYHFDCSQSIGYMLAVTRIF